MQQKVKGNRKVRVPVKGAEIRAMQDAIDHFGYGYVSRDRQQQIAKQLEKVVTRYQALDRG